jgi:hypothetical protein
MFRLYQVDASKLILRISYKDHASAASMGLIGPGSNPGSFRLNVDTSGGYNANGPGRASVRIESVNTWTHALIIGDFAHMPGSVCGVWPAL